MDSSDSKKTIKSLQKREKERVLTSIWYGHKTLSKLISQTLFEKKDKIVMLPRQQATPPSTSPWSLRLSVGLALE